MPAGTRTSTIFVLNLFLGWTLLGWVAALVWSLMVAQVAPKVSRHDDDPRRRCPNCGEWISIHARVCRFASMIFLASELSHASRQSGEQLQILKALRGFPCQRKTIPAAENRTGDGPAYGEPELPARLKPSLVTSAVATKAISIPPPQVGSGRHPIDSPPQEFEVALLDRIFSWQHRVCKRGLDAINEARLRSYWVAECGDVVEAGRTT